MSRRGHGRFVRRVGPEGEQHYSLTAAVEEKQVSKQTIAFYTPGAPRTTFVQGVIKRYPPGPLAHDIKGYHPAGDLERPDRRVEHAGLRRR